MEYKKGSLKVMNEVGEYIEVANQIGVAKTFTDRLIGLMFKNEDEFPKGHALMLVPCSSIHNYFVKFAIDVIYLNKSYEVVKVLRKFNPNEIDRGHMDAFYCIELPSGTLNFNIALNEKVEIEY